MESPYEWPRELRSAVAAFDGDLEWQVLAATVDGPHTGEELVEKLDVEPEAVSEAVSNLTTGGLVSRRNRGDLTDKYDYTVELSEYGSRFVGAMFDTLGDATAGLSEA